MHKLIPFSDIADTVEGVATEGGKKDQYIDIGLHAEGEFTDNALWYEYESYEGYCKGRKQIQHKIEDCGAVSHTEIHTFIYDAAYH